jgi:hypothetical protein
MHEYIAYAALVLLGLLLVAVWVAVGYLLGRALTPRVFISYRRADTWAMAHRLCGDLRDRYGETNVFLDTQDIPYGAQYPGVLTGWLANSNVIVSLVGPEWDGGIGLDNYPRVLNENDWVRHEAEVGYQFRRLVICHVRKTAQHPLPTIPTYSQTDLVRWGRVDQNELLNNLRDMEALSLVEDADGYRHSRGELFGEIDRLHRGSWRWCGMRAWWWIGLPLILAVIAAAFGTTYLDRKQAVEQRATLDPITPSMRALADKVDHHDQAIGKDIPERFKKHAKEIGAVKPGIILPHLPQDFMSLDEAIRKGHKGDYVLWPARYKDQHRDYPIEYTTVELVADGIPKLDAIVLNDSLPDWLTPNYSKKEVIWVVGWISEADKDRIELSGARIYRGVRTSR